MNQLEITQQYVVYQSQTQLVNLAQQVATSRSKQKPAILQAIQVGTQIRLGLEALNYSRFITKPQIDEILYLLSDIADINAYPFAPTVNSGTLPNILIGITGPPGPQGIQGLTGGGYPFNVSGISTDTVVDSFPISECGAAQWSYDVHNASNKRVEQLTGCWLPDGTQVRDNGGVTLDPEIGSTAGITFFVNYSSGFIQLIAHITSGTWDVVGSRVEIPVNGNGIIIPTSLTSGKIYLGNSLNQPAQVFVSGDISLSNTGVASISPGVIVDADISNSAAISLSKLAPGSAVGDILYYNGTQWINFPRGTAGQVLSSTSTTLQWISGGGGGGITNSAAANEMMKSDGVNAVPSGLFAPSLAQLIFGSAAIAGANRSIAVAGSASDIGLITQTKGIGVFTLTDDSPNVYLSASFANFSSTFTGIAQFNVRTSGSTVPSAIRATNQTTATPPLVGIGVGIDFQTQTAQPSTFKIGSVIQSISTNVGTGTEAFDLVFKLMAAGGSASEKFRFVSTGEFSVNGSIGTAGQVLRSGGAGVSPTWATPGIAIGNTVTSGTPGSVLWVGAASALSQDNNNFFWNSASHILSINTAGDQTGVDSINVYNEIDAYNPNSAQGAIGSGTESGFTFSSSRNTGTSPTVLSSGDLVGGVSGWGYTGASPSYQSLAGMWVTTQGVASTLGGKLDFQTRADGGALTSRLTIDNTGLSTFSGKVNLTGTATLAAFNVAGVAGDPSTKVNGDFWYNSTQNTMKMQANSAAIFIVNSATGLSAGRIPFATGLTSTLVDTTNFVYSSTTGLATQNVNITAITKSSGWINTLLVTGAANTAYTAATEFIDIDFNLARSVTWIDGTTPTQRFVYFRGPTVNKTTTSATFTDIYTAFFDVPTAGTGVTFTNTYAAGFGGDVAFVGGGNLLKIRPQFGIINTTLASGYVFQIGGGARFSVNGTTTGSFAFATFAPQSSSTGTPTELLWTGATHTTLTAAEQNDWNINLARTIQFAGSTGFALQRSVLFQAPTYAFVSATGTIVDAATMAITGAPAAGTNAAITNPWALLIQAGNSKSFGKWVFDVTDIAAGTTGNQTINKPSGSVNIAAAGTSVVVTNSFATTTSHIFLCIETVDTTAKSAVVTRAAGSFTITLNAAATAEVRIAFVVYN